MTAPWVMNQRVEVDVGLMWVRGQRTKSSRSSEEEKQLHIDVHQEKQAVCMPKVPILRR